MERRESPKQYDLEEGTHEFAKDVRAFIKKLPHTIANVEDARQLINASGSVGANYIESDFGFRISDFFVGIAL